MVIHFDSGKKYYMPISGAHTVSSCGLSFQDSYIPDRSRHSKNADVVTCKKCLRKSKA